MDSERWEYPIPSAPYKKTSYDLTTYLVTYLSVCFVFSDRLANPPDPSWDWVSSPGESQHQILEDPGREEAAQAVTAEVIPEEGEKEQSGTARYRCYGNP